VAVEFFGVPRLRAGTARLEVEAATLAEALRAVADRCPALAGTVIRGDRVHPAYRVCLNGDRFLDGPGTPLAEGDALLLLAADAGG
jgi:molybdopterin converting factor small subunit